MQSVPVGGERRYSHSVIRVVRGNIFDAQVQALVNPVNCVGVMGKGLALAFKRAFPEMFRAYADACKAGDVVPGRMHLWQGGPGYVINFPTKRHFRSKSRIDDVEAGLEDLVRVVRELELSSLAVPALGAGLGGLEWDAVRVRIEAVLEPLTEADVVLYAPGERV